MLALLISAAVVARAGAAAGAAPRGFILASDVSYLPVLDCDGGCSPFRAQRGGPTSDGLAMLAANGATHVRLRLWVHPSPATPDGWPGPDYTYANLNGTLRMARRVAGAGMRTWLDLHYSDVWADPGHQTQPAAWAGLRNITALAAAVSSFTAAALAALAAQGTPPDVVQVGNEITAGMLWAPAGEPCGDGGALGGGGGCGSNWPSLGALVAAGCAAVRAGAPDALLVVHTDQGSKVAAAGPQPIVDFFTSLGRAGAGDYDAIGLSFYPAWGAGHSGNLAKLAAVVAAFPGKRVLVAETAYPYQDSPSPGGEFPATPAGQLQWVRAVVAGVKALGPAGAGVAWWGGEYYAAQSGAGWTAHWDADGTALPMLQGAWDA